jgi:invasion protein IalB
MNFRNSVVGALASCALLALAAFVPAAAQQAAPGQGPLTATDTKNIGDWEVRCFPVKSPSPCDMFELLADKKTGRRVLSLSIAYVPSQDRHAIQIALPLGVALARGVIISSDTYTSPVMHYRRCDRGGCYVEGLIDNAAIDSIGRASAAKVQFFAYDGANGRLFDLPFSVKGFNEAHSAMSEMARTHTKGAAAAPSAPSGQQ